MRFLLLFLLCATLFGAGDEEAVVYAKEALVYKQRIELPKEFAFGYKEFYLAAPSGLYDKNASLLLLKDGVELLRKGEYNIYAASGSLKLDERFFTLKNFFLSDSLSNLWAMGSSLEGNESKISLEEAFLSSCDVECSDWKFHFRSGSFYKNLHWVNLYNIVMYVKGVPILYFPYIGFSTLRERHTGFLRPVVGLSGKEGFIYIQPFFYAPTHWWDLEIDPQIRTNRGKGLYANLRFVDSPDSFGSIRAGIFVENPSYQKKYDIQNRYHKGVEFYYRRRGIFATENMQDGLYADVKAYTDVDYFNLQRQLSYGFAHSLDISRLNYFLAGDWNYLGLNARYFKYNNETADTEQVHILPSLKFHHFVEAPIKGRGIAYSVDAEIVNYYQKGGLSAVEYDFLLPVRFYTRIADGYVGVSVGEIFSLLYANYYNRDPQNSGYGSYTFWQNAHEFALFGDLGRRYEGFFHVFNYDIRFLQPGVENESGRRASFIAAEDPLQRRLEISIKNFLHRSDDEEYLYHFLNQRIDYEDSNIFEDLQNEIGVRKGAYELNLNTLYSIKERRLNTLSVTADYGKDRTGVSLSYLFRRQDFGNSRFFIAKLHGDLANHNELFATIDYNIELGKYKSWSIGWKKRMRCWSLLMRYERDTVPILTQSGPGSFRNDTFMVRLELYPLGVISHSYVQSTDQRMF